MTAHRLILGDCIEKLRELNDASVDAVVTDPPYSIRFMGRAWDSHGDFQTWTREWGAECLRVLKPGGHALVFGGTRTYHRLTCGLEDAGFEIRDCLAWLYGTGFPKSLDVSKAIDAAAGAEREVVAVDGGKAQRGAAPSSRYEKSEQGWARPNGRYNVFHQTGEITAPATPDAARWQGWGTALKPAFEPIVVARKPLTGTVAVNVLAHGTGALNIDASRIEADARPARAQSDDRSYAGTTYGGGRGVAGLADGTTDLGRWPANVVLDEEAAWLLDEQTGKLAPGASPPKKGLGSARVYGDADRAGVDKERVELDGGGASRFFYVAKTSRAERNAGSGRSAAARNHHPTVKPVALMRWLVRLVTPPGGHVLDPFLGSGTTGIASTLEGFRFTGIEREPDYLQIAAARLAYWAEHGDAALQVARRAEATERERATVAASGQISFLDDTSEADA